MKAATTTTTTTASQRKRVAIITGGNSGVGYGIALRLLLRQLYGLSTDADNGSDLPVTNKELDEQFKIVLACRNEKRAAAAKRQLIDEVVAYGSLDRQHVLDRVDIEVLLVDVSDLHSVQAAAHEAVQRFPVIDLLFCNAGVMPVAGINWSGVLRDLFTNIVDLMTVGTNAFKQPVGLTTSEGVGAVFAANALGHYLLIRLLEKQLAASGDARVIFTSSKTGFREYFDPNDIEGVKNLRAYQSSKYVVDALTVYCNDRLRHRDSIRVVSTCPGTVYTRIIDIALPSWVVVNMYRVMRTAIPELTVTAHCGSVAQFHAAHHDHVDPAQKHFSRATRWGHPYVSREPLGPANRATAEEIKADAAAIGAHCDKLIAPFLTTQ
ncbi:3-keto-steroid reductase [Sorochytrium milnesiophthora]